MVAEDLTAEVLLPTPQQVFVKAYRHAVAKNICLVRVQTHVSSRDPLLPVLWEPPFLGLAFLSKLDRLQASGSKFLIDFEDFDAARLGIKRTLYGRTENHQRHQ